MHGAVCLHVFFFAWFYLRLRVFVCFFMFVCAFVWLCMFACAFGMYSFGFRVWRGTIKGGEQYTETVDNDSVQQGSLTAVVPTRGRRI